MSVLFGFRVLPIAWICSFCFGRRGYLWKNVEKKVITFITLYTLQYFGHSFFDFQTHMVYFSLKIMRIDEEWKHHITNWSENVRLGGMVCTLSMVFISRNGFSAFKHWSNPKILALRILHWPLGSANFRSNWPNCF